MGVILSDRVRETTTDTGTGNLTLAGAVTGYRAFGDVYSATDYIVYLIDGGAEWEVGIGQAASVVIRTLVLASSNGGALVSFSAGTKTVSMSGSTLPGAWGSQLFGSGDDGDASITTTVTLTQDAHYKNLTISGSGKLIPNGNRVFVSEVLDIDSAAADAITGSGGNGSAGPAQSTTPTAAPGGTAGTIGSIGVGRTGGVGGTSTALDGSGTAPGTGNSASPGNGGSGGNGGAGGASNGPSGRAGGGFQTGASASSPMVYLHFAPNQLRGASLLLGGAGGAGGSLGGTDGVTATPDGLGGNGGGGGAGGDCLFISARVLKRGSAPAGAISSNGGNGGGVTNNITNGDTGAGGGGGGGGGGFITIVYGTLVGAAVTNLIKANGGTGGRGGDGYALGDGGNGGAGGKSGRIVTINAGIGAATATDSGSPASGSSGSAGATGTTPATVNAGGAGGAGGTAQVTL